MCIIDTQQSAKQLLFSSLLYNVKYKTMMNVKENIFFIFFSSLTQTFMLYCDVVNDTFNFISIKFNSYLVSAVWSCCLVMNYRKSQKNIYVRSVVAMWMFGEKKINLNNFVLLSVRRFIPNPQLICSFFFWLDFFFL